MRIPGLVAAISCLTLAASVAQKAVPAPSPLRLPMSTVFQGESKFYAILAKAERENWRKLPLGERTVRVAPEMAGTPYVNFTLEVYDRIEKFVAHVDQRFNRLELKLDELRSSRE